MQISFKPQGVCSSQIDFELENGVITRCSFQDGCRGNTQGVARLAVGRPAEEIISLLRGIECRGGTSCPDQLAQALEQALAQ